MEEKVASGLREQQARRKRINRMKMFLVAGIVIWIIVLTVLMAALLMKVLQLEERLNEAIVSKEEITLEHDAKSAGSPTESASDIDLADDTSAEGVVAEIDQEDSMEPLPEEQEGVPEEEISDDSDALEGEIAEDSNALEEGEHPKVYLTFDDGPSVNTSKILDILKAKNIKATFFVIGQEDEESKALYRRIVDEGHTLGMHSFSHKYDVIYQSLDAFQEDMEHLQSYLEEVTGVTPTIMRFPGGSSNKVSNVDIEELIRYVKEKGITYYDWNVVSGDATSQVYTPDELVANVMEDVVKYHTSIVLMHDSSAKGSTVDALLPMIDQLQEMGAELLPIDEATKPIQHIKAEDVE